MNSGEHDYVTWAQARIKGTEAPKGYFSTPGGNFFKFWALHTKILTFFAAGGEIDGSGKFLNIYTIMRQILNTIHNS